MKINAPQSGDADKKPTGQCPLCYAENSYEVSICVECSFALPWAKAEMSEREPHGVCVKCHANNLYSSQNCRVCEAFLPWAYAISTVAEAQALWGQSPALPAHSASGFAAPVRSVGYAGNHSLTALDGRNQFVDAISFLCPALGFVAYISLINRLPQQASSAAKYAVKGLCLWLPVLLILFIRSR